MLVGIGISTVVGSYNTEYSLEVLFVKTYPVKS